MQQSPPPTIKPWEHAKSGGGSGTDPLAARFVESLSYDIRLYDADIRGSLAHAAGLERAGLLNAEELMSIRRGLAEIKAEIEGAAGGISRWSGWKVELEDVHMCIEAALIAKIGDAGRKLHTGRSRNDQVALDLRLWLRDAAVQAQTAATALCHALRNVAEEQGDIVLPGYTHLQRAQPITLGAELNAWNAMLNRDSAMFRLLADNNSQCPIGSGALAGSTLPLDRSAVADDLGFSGPSPSSIDSTASRDEALDYLYALSRTAMHLSRLAEQWILYCTTEFGFVKIDEKYTTGSSMMPQKRNPDMLELIRGRAGGVYSHLMALLTICKGLPLGYNRDLQEDKRHVFAAHDTVMDCLEMATRIIATAKFDQDRINSAGGGLDRGYLDATVLAELLVRSGVPFRTAHQVVGALVAQCEASGRESLRQLAASEIVHAVKAAGQSGAGLDPVEILSSLGADNVVDAYVTDGHAGTGTGGYVQALLGRAPERARPGIHRAPAVGTKLAPPHLVRDEPTEPQPDVPAGPRPKMPVLRGGRPVLPDSAETIARGSGPAPSGTIQHGVPPPTSVAALGGTGEPVKSLFAAGGEQEDRSTASHFNQRLIEAYVAVGRTLDDLPYTEEFLRVCELAGAAEAGMSEQAVFRRLQNTRKAGKLPPIGKAPSRPPKISIDEEEWLRNAVEEAVGTLGQRDQLPFTDRFEQLLNRFNQTSGRRMDPHDLWRVIAKIAK